jgi:hypothetical protein
MDDFNDGICLPAIPHTMDLSWGYPGRAFESLPNKWTFPFCGAPKGDFIKEER